MKQLNSALAFSLLLSCFNGYGMETTDQYDSDPEQLIDYAQRELKSDP